MQKFDENIKRISVYNQAGNRNGKVNNQLFVCFFQISAAESPEFLESKADTKSENPGDYRRSNIINAKKMNKNKQEGDLGNRGRPTGYDILYYSSVGTGITVNLRESSFKPLFEIFVML